MLVSPFSNRNQLLYEAHIITKSAGCSHYRIRSKKGLTSPLPPRGVVLNRPGFDGGYGTPRIPPRQFSIERRRPLRTVDQACPWNHSIDRGRQSMVPLDNDGGHRTCRVTASTACGVRPCEIALAHVRQLHRGLHCGAETPSPDQKSHFYDDITSRRCNQA
jgi:hypothetical protein